MTTRWRRKASARTRAHPPDYLVNRRHDVPGGQNEALTATIERTDDAKRCQLSLEMPALATRHQVLAQPPPTLL